MGVNPTMGLKGVPPLLFMIVAYGRGQWGGLLIS